APATRWRRLRDGAGYAMAPATRWRRLRDEGAVGPREEGLEELEQRPLLQREREDVVRRHPARVPPGLVRQDGGRDAGVARQRADRGERRARPVARPPMLDEHDVERDRLRLLERVRGGLDGDE